VEKKMKRQEDPEERHLVPSDTGSIIERNASAHPTWADFQNRWGLLLLVRGEIHQALAVFEKCLRINPGYAWAAVNRIQTLGLAGKVDEARRALGEISEPSPGARGMAEAFLDLLDSRTAEGLAILQGLPASLNRRVDVLRLQAALTLASSSEAAAELWDLIKDDFGDLDPSWTVPWDESENVAPKLTTFVAGVHELYLEASSVAARLGRTEEATTLAHAMYLHWADEAAFLTQCGFVTDIAGEGEKAIDLYVRAARISPDSPRALVALTYHWSAAGDLDRARISLEKALTLRPRYADLQYQLGLLRRAKGDAEGALESFERALSINQDFTVARMQAAGVLFQLQRWEESLEAYEAVLQAGLGSIDTYLQLGQIHAQLGRLTEAETAYSEALRIEPNDATAHTQLEELQKRLGKSKKKRKVRKRSRDANRKG
jgi:tetratricopeptide (TPR) repeat protein